MRTVDSASRPGFAPEPLSSRVFIRCYRHYGQAKRAYDELRVVAGIPDKRMTVVARGLEWREPFSHGALLKILSGAGAALIGALAGSAAGVVVARLRDRRRGLAQTGHVAPRQYDILVEEQLAPRAREVLCQD